MPRITGIPLSISVNSGEPQQVFGEIVSGNYFSVLGAKPAIGRTFTPDEDQTPGDKLVAVLGYGEWQKLLRRRSVGRGPHRHAQRPDVRRSSA